MSYTQSAVGVSQVEASAVWGGLAVGLCGSLGGLPADRKINDREGSAGFTLQEGVERRMMMKMSLAVNKQNVSRRAKDC